jgi:hypothetical protein
VAGGTTNKDAIRQLEKLAAAHEERFLSLRGEVNRLAEQVRDAVVSSGRLERSQSEARESLVRHDERLSQLEQRRERRWNLLLGLLCAVAGSLVTVIAQWLFADS